jgi:L,D-transpeptidase ErfK/SrfK
MKNTLAFSLLLLWNAGASALTLAAPDRAGDSIIGAPPHEAKYISAKYEDTLIDIARELRIGQDEIVQANPKVDRWLPGANTKVRIPSSYILPNAPRQGIVINIPEMHLYYYADPQHVMIYSIGIGRENWKTPVGTTRITGKQANPSWTPPPSIMAEHIEAGDPLKPFYPPGPDNPLGMFAFKLGIPGYLIHSTSEDKVDGIGMRVSHGCIRMYPSDIEKFFPLIPVGTPVTLVNQSIKVGWYHDTLYLQAYPELEETPLTYEQRIELALDLIQKANGGRMPVIKGSVLKLALESNSTLPVAIYEREHTADQAAMQNDDVTH